MGAGVRDAGRHSTHSRVEPVFPTFLDLLHPDDRARTSEAVRVHLEEHASYDLEFRLREPGSLDQWEQRRRRRALCWVYHVKL